MFDVCVFPVEEVIDCKRIGFIYMLRAVNRLKHRSNNDVSLSGLITVRSKSGFLAARKFHAACSPSFFEALYPRTGDCVLTTSSSVTW
jgi:hypothetical protein